MKTYKIKVSNKEENKEAQELLFELGYKWSNHGKFLGYLDANFFFAESDGRIEYETSNEYVFNEEEYREVTLPQLRDLVVLRRNDVIDATHIDQDGWHWYVNKDNFNDRDDDYGYVWKAGNAEQKPQWDKSVLIHSDLKPITQEPKMTYQNALRSIADGKDIEVFNPYTELWESIRFFTISDIQNKNLLFRIKSKYVTLKGQYTKKDLVEIIEDM